MDKRSFVFVLVLSISIFFLNQWLAPPYVPMAPKQVQELFQDGQEKLYVLENDTQQIVFSNLGGAIKELNLPFESTENAASIVRPIEFDRKLAKQSPINVEFPLSEANFFNQESNKVEAYTTKKGGYTPLLRRSIKLSEKGYSFVVKPEHYMCQLLGEQGKYVAKTFQMTRITKDSIEFTGDVFGQKVTKKYQLKSPYGFSLTLEFSNPQNDHVYLTSGITEVELVGGGYNPIIQMLSTKGEKFVTEKVDLPTKEINAYLNNTPVWISNSNGFFGTILGLNQAGTQPGFAVDKIEGQLCPTRLSLIDQKYELYPIDNYPGYQVVKQILPKKQAVAFEVYAGPYQEKTLQEAQNNYAQNPQFGLAPSVQGFFSFISEPFAKLIFFLMQLCYKLTNSWGLSVIGAALAIRILFYPLNYRAQKSQLAMQQIQPQLDEIQERYKKDPMKAYKERARILQEKKINPASGCLFSLLQIPFLIGVYDLMKTSFELRGVSFLFPSWIPNLAAPDVLFSWSFPIPFIGNELHILPILGGFINLMMMRGSTAASANKEMQHQQANMQLILFFVFTFMFYKFSAGLNLYYGTMSLLSVIQNFVTRKRVNKSKIEILKK
jgi:YidC/Oxa1 family membrane protein insertase